MQDAGEPGPDKRKYERRAGSGLLAWSLMGGTGKVVDSGAGAFLELSLDGAAFLCARTFAPQERLDLEMQLRDDIVRLSGPVVRCEPSGVESDGHRVVMKIERATPSYAQLLSAYFPG